jgi:uncharacterized protein YcbK (DUF882 family)
LDGSCRRARLILIVLLALAATTQLSAGSAAAESRTLKLYFIHTKERAEITYKVNGKYVDAGLRKVNRLLRDWRRDEPTKMDPRLLDLVWEVYQRSGSKDYINVVSAYRSPATNDMLRKRSRGVAKNSQHMLGKAMDFFLPDVNLAKLREIGLKEGVGGVGYYPTSGSPFVHMDTGRVRHWPRMTRQQLVQIFPDGKTMHIPSDGKPLPGYEIALANYKAGRSNAGEIKIATVEEVKEPNFFERWANRTKENQKKEVGDSQIAAAENNDDDDEDSAADTQVAELRSADGSEFTLPDTVPVPLPRPGATSAGTLIASGDRVNNTGSGASQTRLASLTPGEIEELRRSAVGANREVTSAQIVSRISIEDRLAPISGEMPRFEAGQSLAFAAPVGQQGPRPAADIPVSQPATLSVPSVNMTPVVVASLQVPANASDAVERMAAQSRPAQRDGNRETPQAVTDIGTTGTVPTPMVRPQAGLEEATLELALAEPDATDSAREAIRKLVDADRQLAMLQKQVIESGENQLQGVTGGASNEVVWQLIEASPPPPAVRKLALGRLYLGRWAMMAGHSLLEIDQLSAPTYGQYATVENRNQMVVAGFVKAPAELATVTLLRR